ncbi:mpv17-like protein 2 [Tetranychus urticae]|uniref:Mpv17-like protein 2 n=1 Tax=Tetranychus urticae TaxID=32264 RepID=T1KFQ4_TETUR|nr:mpv17-like protein 2 [Tetranychus urticae]
MVVGSHLKRILNLAFSPRYLMFTNTTIGTGALVGADLIQQLATHYVYPKQDDFLKKDDCDSYKHDTRRSIGMAAGGLYFGFAGHYWYEFLDKKFPGRSIAIVSKKLMCEAIIGPPFVTVCYFIVAKTEGKTTQEWYKSFKETILYIIFSEWFGFLPLQAFNFYLLPPKYRYLCVAGLTFFYDNFLSFIFHK